MNKNAFFQNTDCEYFPCHSGVCLDDFNCMFCYCPLYVLGDECGGKYKILQSGVKDCSDCVLCHGKNAYRVIESKFTQISNIERKNRK